MRVFINGFGRIGRSVLRAYLQSPDRWPGLDIAGINDIAAPEMCAYLFEFDSVFGPWRGQVSLDHGALVVDGRRDPAAAARRTCPPWIWRASIWSSNAPVGPMRARWRNGACGAGRGRC